MTRRFRLLLLLLAAGCDRGEEPAINAVTLLPVAIGAPAGEPNLNEDDSGNIYLTWIEQNPDTTHALKFAVLRGDSFAAPRTIAAGRGWFVNWADFPTLAAHPNGTLAAHWLERSTTSRYSYDVRVALSTDGGNSWSAPVTPHLDRSAAEHGFVSLFPLGNSIGAIWLDGRDYALKKAAGDTMDAGEMMVRFTTLTPGGAAADTALDRRACDCCQTSAALAESGPLVVYRDRSADEIRDIYITRQVDGTWTEGKPVHADGWRVDYCPVNGPAVAARGRRVAVAWFTMADSIPRVRVAFSNDAGATFAAPIQVDLGNPAGRVDVQLTDDDDALVTWIERETDKAGILVRRVSPSGKLSLVSRVADTIAERPSGFPHMIVHGNDVFFAWTVPGAQPTVRVGKAQLQ